MPPKKGTPPWEFQSLEEVTGSKDVLEYAYKWCADHNFDPIVKFGNLVIEGVHCGCQIASCDGHLNCTKQYRFSLRSKSIFDKTDLLRRPGDLFFLVEKRGGPCNTSEPNHEAAKKRHTRNFAALNISPSKVDRVCEGREIPTDSRPDPTGISNRKYS